MFEVGSARPLQFMPAEGWPINLFFLELDIWPMIAIDNCLITTCDWLALRVIELKGRVARFIETPVRFHSLLVPASVCGICCRSSPRLVGGWTAARKTKLRPGPQQDSIKLRLGCLKLDVEESPLCCQCPLEAFDQIRRKHVQRGVHRCETCGCLSLVMLALSCKKPSAKERPSPICHLPKCLQPLPPLAVWRGFGEPFAMSRLSGSC